jgi:HK97 family phage major capsid protein/HK97 family phage prohead protease
MEKNKMTRKHNDYMREIIQLRAEETEDKKMIVEGKAITYNDPTRLFKAGDTEYYEVIERGAFKNADLKDAFFKYNHSDEQLVLARYKNKTLTFDERDDGVYIRAELADTALGRDLYTLIKRGDIDKMSFAFTIKKQSREEDKAKKTVTFRISEFDKIYDVAAVPLPAYQNTDIYARRQGEVEADLARVEALERENIKNKIKKGESRKMDRQVEISKRLAEIKATELKDLSTEELKKILGEQETLEREKTILDIQMRNATMMPDSAFKPAVTKRTEADKEECHPTDTLEYRKAFMRFVQTGEKSEVLKRADTYTSVASDAGAAVPQTVVNEIIKEMKAYGDIFARVRKLNVKGGVSFPISTLRPTATWIGETSGSSQKLATQPIIFNYYGLECKIAQSLVSSIVTLDAFQAEFITAAVEALTQAIEIAIFNGTGEDQPLGILKDTRVPAANKIPLTSADMTWANLKKKVFGKMKKAYRKGAFIMAQSTFDGYIDGMVDGAGQPIGRVNYGIAGSEEYRFGGKEVITVEDDIITAFDDAATGDVFGVFVNLNDYAINSNLSITTVKWTDHDAGQVKNKAVLVCDGKLLDPNGCILLTKGA